MTAEQPGRPTVCALLPAGAPLESALSEAGARPDHTVSADGAADDGLRRAVETDCDWLWMLEPTTRPRAGSLDAFIAALDRARGLAAPTLLASVVLDGDDEVDAPRSAWYRRNQIDLAMTSSPRRLLPIRAAAGPLLVRRDAAAQAPPLRELSAAGLLEWTAWILRDRTGYLVPGSEASAVTRVADPLGSPSVAARLVFGGSLARFDRVRAAREFLERAAERSVRGRAKAG